MPPAGRDFSAAFGLILHNTAGATLATRIYALGYQHNVDSEQCDVVY